MIKLVYVINSSNEFAFAQLKIISNLPLAFATYSGFLVQTKSTAPYDLASASLSAEVDIAVVLIPNAAENLIAKWPSPPIPKIPTSLFAPKCLLSGAYTVIPAHKRGGARCYGIVLGIGNAHFAGN